MTIAAGIYVDIPAVVEFYKNCLDHVTVGHRDMNARCPNREHDDHDPSWGINMANGRFNCYGCGWSGDIFEFIKEMEAQLRGKDICRAPAC